MPLALNKNHQNLDAREISELKWKVRNMLGSFRSLRKIVVADNGSCVAAKQPVGEELIALKSWDVMGRYREMRVRKFVEEQYQMELEDEKGENRLVFKGQMKKLEGGIPEVALVYNGDPFSSRSSN